MDINFQVNWQIIQAAEIKKWLIFPIGDIDFSMSSVEIHNIHFSMSNGWQ